MCIHRVQQNHRNDQLSDGSFIGYLPIFDILLPHRFPIKPIYSIFHQRFNFLATQLTPAYVRLVTRGHFRLRDKDGGYTIRSAIFENPKLHANLMALCFIEAELWPIEVYCWNRIFYFIRSCDLYLVQINFIYELDPYSLQIYRMCKYELPTSRLSKVIV